MVPRDNPLAYATAAAPSKPNASASAAATRRRVRSDRSSSVSQPRSCRRALRTSVVQRATARAQSPKLRHKLRMTNRKQSYSTKRFADGQRVVRPGDGLASRTAAAPYFFAASVFGFGAAAGFGFQNAGSTWMTSSGGLLNSGRSLRISQWLASTAS